jgi:mannose-6-phosphate isomerase-like protein (cupin superfamily)
VFPEIPSAHGHISSEHAPRGNGSASLVVAEGPETGSPWLKLSILDVAPGGSADRPGDDRETVVFVVQGSGTITAGGAAHALEPHTGLLIPANSNWEVENAGADDLRIVAVAFEPVDDAAAEEVAVVRLADQKARAATGDRSFRVVVDPAVGCRTVTQFVGFVPPGRAPEHFHQYDEVIYVLEGRGVLHMDGRSTPFGAGTTIHLPPRLVHCLENVGDRELVVLGVFTPAGSPSDAFYPDGTRAYYDPQ